MDDDTTAQTRDNDATSAAERGGDVTQADLDKLERRMKDEAAAKAKRDGEIAEIRDLGKRYGLEERAEELVTLEASPADMRAAVRNSLINAAPQPVPATSGHRVSGGTPRHTGKLMSFEASP